MNIENRATLSKESLATLNSDLYDLSNKLLAADLAGLKRYGKLTDSELAHLVSKASKYTYRANSKTSSAPNIAEATIKTFLAGKRRPQRRISKAILDFLRTSFSIPQQAYVLDSSLVFQAKSESRRFQTSHASKKLLKLASGWLLFDSGIRSNASAIQLIHLEDWNVILCRGILVYDENWDATQKFYLTGFATVTRNHIVLNLADHELNSFIIYIDVSMGPFDLDDQVSQEPYFAIKQVRMVAPSHYHISRTPIFMSPRDFESRLQYIEKLSDAACNEFMPMKFIHVGPVEAKVCVHSAEIDMGTAINNTFPLLVSNSQKLPLENRNTKLDGMLTHRKLSVLIRRVEAEIRRDFSARSRVLQQFPESDIFIP
ncbi:hypothetical protein [Hyphomonas atlantica]|uniref:Uncharacterized protein n=1 Tax=Hyphomonas atlantica TaxID=1280948 RepID=A0A059E1C8_9PROT|nr:hypothetical protein [Hyphomonas atlantica]KCZ61428.1 hypothetical protein HY36_16795 [Hyphomonas atlantica]